MQTFLPYADFTASARVLDNKRLGKQRVEAYQILRCLLGEGSLQWQHHPAVKMWKGYCFQLARYGYVVCKEWKRRGYRDTVQGKIVALVKIHPRILYDVRLPSWIGDVTFHRSHQSNLLRKDNVHYAKHFKHVRDNLPYVWPVA